MWHWLQTSVRMFLTRRSSETKQLKHKLWHHWSCGRQIFQRQNISHSIQGQQSFVTWKFDKRPSIHVRHRNMMLVIIFSLSSCKDLACLLTPPHNAFLSALCIDKLSASLNVLLCFLSVLSYKFCSVSHSPRRYDFSQLFSCEGLSMC